MRVIEASNRSAVERIVNEAHRSDPKVTRAARRIVDEVRRGGDRALRRHASFLDGWNPREPLVLDRRSIESGAHGVAREVRAAIRLAARNIRHVAERELVFTRRVAVAPGVNIVLRRSPLARVGCYVPGGRHSLVSSLLMTAIPARVAGVREIVVACPRPAPAVLYAARLAGVTALLRAGGAQAIAALAYGTETIPRVDKIVGPGNAYVAAAKAIVAPHCAIDFHAGPTELVVLSKNGPADWIAADLVAQAEHDPGARAILLTPNRRLARAAAERIRALAGRRGAAAEALARRGAAIVTASMDEAVDLACRLAPEHLACDDGRIARRVTTAGTIFVGPFSAPASGDYATGSNHVLPTSGAARARGGLSAMDFIKTTSIQKVSRAGLRRIAPAVLALARAEGLEGHARSIEVRL